MTESNKKFQECATCAAKPGHPILCDSCLNNRELISWLLMDISTLRLRMATLKKRPYHFFTCPECGGHHFGTWALDKKDPQGRCHDEYGIGCEYVWDRNDDEKLGFLEDVDD